MANDLAFRLKQMEEFFHLDYHRIKKISREAGDRIDKLEAALRWYAEHCQKSGDDIEGPEGDYGERARKALDAE